MNLRRFIYLVFSTQLLCSCDQTDQDKEFMRSLKASNVASVVVGIIDESGFRQSFKDPQKYATPMGSAQKETLLKALKSATYSQIFPGSNHPSCEERWLYFKIAGNEWVVSVDQCHQSGGKRWMDFTVAKPGVVLSWGHWFVIDDPETMKTIAEIIK